MSMNQQGKKWCFTINNYLPEDLELIKTYGIYGGANQERAPTTGTPHIQAFVVFKTNQRKKALCELNPRASWRLMGGTIEQSEVYCSKEESRIEGTEPFVWGERPVNRQGKRSDLDTAYEAMEQTVGGVRARMDAAMDAAPAAFMRYAGGMERAAAALTRRSVKPRAMKEYNTWQKELAEYLDREADDRTILWYTDIKGGQGKSTFITQWLLRNSPGGTAQGIMLEGRVADMAYAFQVEHRVVFFDVTRTQAENMDHLYSFAEKLKNGMLMSTKYQSEMKVFDPPHVVFFANMPPPAPGTKWSSDRVIEKVLGDAPAPLTF